MKTKIEHRLSGLGIALLLCVALTAAASPWDSWRMAYTSFEQGEKLRDSGDYVKALAAFSEALKHYQSVRVARPDWNQRVISARIAECERERSKIHALLGRETVPAKRLEQGQKQLASVSSEAALLKRQLDEKNAELQKLQAASGREKRLEAEIANLIRDQRQAAEKYALLKRQLAEREKAASVPSALAKKLKTRLEEEKVRAESLSKQTEELSSQLKKREDDLRAANLSKESAELELKRAREELNATRESFQKQQQDQNASGSETQRLKVALTEAENNSRTASEQCAALKKELAKTAEKLRQVQNANAGKTNVPQPESPFVAENRRLFQENTALRTELAEGQAKLQQASAAEQKNRSLLAELEASLQRVVSARNAVEKENLTLRASLEQAEKAQKDSGASLSRKEQERAKLEQDFRSLVQKNRKLEARLEERSGEDFAALTASKEKMDRLNAEMDQLQTALLNWKHRAEALTLENQQLSGNLKTAAESAAKAQQKQQKLTEELQKAVAAADQLRELSRKYQELQKNFTALQAENRENRLLAEAAKPREAELANVKLRLADLDRLKSELAREQRLNGELLVSVRKLEKQLAQAKVQESQLLTLKRDLPEIETLRADLAKFRKLNAELTAQKRMDGEVSALKLKLAEANAKAADRDRLQKLNAELLAMQKAQRAELTSLENVKRERDLLKLEAASPDRRPGEKNSGQEKKNISLARENLELKTTLAQRTRQVSDAQKAIQREQEKYGMVKAEIAQLKKINAELASAKAMEGEIAKLRLQLAEAETMRGELARLERLCRELTEIKEGLEKDLISSRNSPVPGMDFTASPVKENPDDLVASGVLAESDGNLELAVWNYRQALRANREHAGAARRLGRIRFLRHEYQEAAALLGVARTAAPKDPELGHMAASTAIALKRFGNARGILEPLLKAHPDNWKLQVDLALVEQGSGETANAEKRLQFAQRLAPQQPLPRVELARLIISSNPLRKEEAARLYESARSLGGAPDLGLETNLADVLDKRRDSASFLQAAAGEAESAGDWKSAVWYYRQLQELDWTPETMVPKLAFARFKEGNPAAAQEVLRFSKRGGRSALAEIVSMLICYRTGNTNGAVNASRRALSANGGTPVEIPLNCGALNAELASTFSDTGKAAVRICREAYLGIGASSK